jgi:3-deoxy-D-manno-octulosonic-acid transferase
MMASAPPRSLTLAAYRAAAGLVSPLARPLLEARARRGKEDLERLDERLGRTSIARPQGSLVWFHAVSVGESLSILPVISAVVEERADVSILVTSGTRASAEILARRLPPGAIHQYAPIDTPGAVRRFLAQWRPDTGVFVESELWPNLILAARGAGVRLALVSARMTERSARAWRSRPAAARAMLSAFDLVLAQDAATEDRLVGLGGHVSGRLNLKRVGDPLPVDGAELARLRAIIGDRPVLAAISTHAPEERLVAAAAERLPAKTLTVIVPRHPERGEAITRELAGSGVARRAAGEAIEPGTRIYVADTLAEVGLFLRLAQLAVVGGGFAEGLGGHNPLEPARLGVGVVSGPHVANFADIYAEMTQAGAALVVADGAELAEALAGLFAEPQRLAALGAAALAFAERQGDQLRAGLDLIRPLLPAS